MRYVPLSNEFRTDTIKKVQRKKIILDDYRIGLNNFFQSVEFSFDLSIEPIRVLGYNNKFLNSITYEISRD